MVATVPPQTIETGAVRLQVVEGFIDKHNQPANNILNGILRSQGQRVPARGNGGQQRSGGGRPAAR